MELAFMEELHGKARSVAQLKLSGFGSATMGRQQIMGLNWTLTYFRLGFMLKIFIFFLCILHVLSQFFIYVYIYLFFSGKFCLEGIVNLLVESLYVFDFFTSLHSNSKHNRWLAFAILLFTIYLKEIHRSSNPCNPKTEKLKQTDDTLQSHLLTLIVTIWVIWDMSV